MADRIDHSSAHMPAPTRDLLLRMAVAGHAMSCRCAAVQNRIPPFDGLGSDVQDTWLSVAQAMYAEVAVMGGARVMPVEPAGDANA